MAVRNHINVSKVWYLESHIQNVHFFPSITFRWDTFDPPPEICSSENRLA